MLPTTHQVVGLRAPLDRASTTARRRARGGGARDSHAARPARQVDVLGGPVGLGACEHQTAILVVLVRMLAVAQISACAKSKIAASASPTGAAIAPLARRSPSAEAPPTRQRSFCMRPWKRGLGARRSSGARQGARQALVKALVRHSSRRSSGARQGARQALVKALVRRQALVKALVRHSSRRSSGARQGARSLPARPA